MNGTKTIEITVETLSPLALGFGKGDIIVDAEAVHDRYGLPYIPAKRWRGLLYESAREVVAMLKCCGREEIAGAADLTYIFGGQEGDGHLAVYNLRLKDYDAIAAGWRYLQEKYPAFVTAADVLEEYASLRYQTKIDAATGVAADGSLRNIRAVNAGLAFSGEMRLDDKDDGRAELLLLLALKNLRYIGSKRNRGFGQIKCRLSAAAELRLTQAGFASKEAEKNA